MIGSTRRLQRRVVACPKGMEIADGLPFEVWVELGRRTLVAYVDDKSSMTSWLLGDWYLYGFWEYGGRADDAVAEVAPVYGISVETIRRRARICESVDFPRRRGNLSFGHHRLIARLEAAEQERWLGRAEREGWTARELRAELSAARAIVPG